MQNYYIKFLNMCKFAHDRKTSKKYGRILVAVMGAWEREELVGIGNGEDSYRPLQACHWTSSATVKMHTPPTFMLCNLPFLKVELLISICLDGTRLESKRKR